MLPSFSSSLSGYTTKLFLSSEVQATLLLPGLWKPFPLVFSQCTFYSKMTIYQDACLGLWDVMHLNKHDPLLLQTQRCIICRVVAMCWTLLGVVWILPQVILTSTSTLIYRWKCKHFLEVKKLIIGRTQNLSPVISSQMFCFLISKEVIWEIYRWKPDY